MDEPTKKPYNQIKNMAVLDIAVPSFLDESHYYGCLKFYNKDNELQQEDIYRRLTRSEAKKLNKNHRRIYPGVYAMEKFERDRDPFREGQVYPGYDSREELVVAAIEKYHELGLDIGLVIRRWASIEPGKVLVEVGEGRR